MMLRAHFASGKIKCPQLQNPQLSKKKSIRVEAMSNEGKMVAAKMICELKRLFGDEPRTLQEKKVIYLDPRLKSTGLYEQRNLEGEVA